MIPARRLYRFNSQRNIAVQSISAWQYLDTHMDMGDYAASIEAGKRGDNMVAFSTAIDPQRHCSCCNRACSYTSDSTACTGPYYDPVVVTSSTQYDRVYTHILRRPERVPGSKQPNNTWVRIHWGSAQCRRVYRDSRKYVRITAPRRLQRGGRKGSQERPT